MKEINRRTFLKIGGALAVGLAVGEFGTPMKAEINKAVERATGHPTGNAGMRQKIEDACGDANNLQECAQSYQVSPTDKILGTIVWPPMEEFIMRGLPSAVVSVMEDRENCSADVLIGTGGWSMTRGEFLMGIATSIMFGAAHNITKKGIDTETIPASQTVSGMVLWYLQRKLGIASNTLAHAWANFRLLNQQSTWKVE